MRRALLIPRTARSLTQALLQGQPRRMFATPPIKSQTPPEPLDASNEQAMPLGPYYDSIIHDPQPIPEEKPEAPPSSISDDAPSPSPKAPRGRKSKDDTSKKATAMPSSSPPIPTPSATTPPSGEAKARVVFGSTLAGPAERAERLAAIRRHSRIVAGIMVPPRPEEPDNCCMSGCVNCVWDRYRDEMEWWASANAEAERRLRAQEAGVGTTAAAESVTTSSPAVSNSSSMDDDGGGSVGSWDIENVAGQGVGGTLTKDFWDDELYKNVPVGIREFMKQEKRLKQKHMKEGTFGG
ncbi:hypothetical protein CONLIGDRAFT_584269 [Coniochaeta ligniaria NRRL 30616]|uniref:Oxidoreductase-like domain-containing protein n=1 Tax=Coniochaeta ligniaria NRRL 30616 TaxID=1408157 RepID=A0A1J7IBK4_9PEZI|nr:hypothetical protein CONLIGDRAFT_584269 [Coniochaeta ligniaria NRRL 30616]